jgi:hypothetical protein
MIVFPKFAQTEKEGDIPNRVQIGASEQKNMVAGKDYHRYIYDLPRRSKDFPTQHKPPAGANAFGSVLHKHVY